MSKKLDALESKYWNAKQAFIEQLGREFPHGTHVSATLSARQLTPTQGTVLCIPSCSPGCIRVRFNTPQKLVRDIRFDKLSRLN